ncbi:MAG: hypothetical protein AB7P76_02460 [Candidatus Melainabacteria bacterium]
MAIVSKLSHEDHQKSTWTARIIYGLIMLTFLSVCSIAVISVMQAERHKTTFKAITVKKPISFVDSTYLPEKTAKK